MGPTKTLTFSKVFPKGCHVKYDPTIQAGEIFSFTPVSVSSVDKYPSVGLSPQRNELTYLI